MNINLTLIGQSITFAVFVWFCYAYVWPPLVKALDDRKKKIADGLAAAERGAQQQELAEKHAKDELKKAKADAAEIINSANKRKNEIVEQAKQDARVEAERIVTAARAEVEQEANKAREELRRSVATLAMAGASQVLQAEVDIRRHNDMLEKLAAEL